MKEIREMKAFMKEIEVVHLPASRIIGKEVRNGGSLGNTAPALWDAIYASQDHVILEKLPHVVSQDLFGWTLEYDPESKTFAYIVCALTPAGTPVPNGFTYRDIPETLCAVGLYGESVNQTLKKIALQGFEANWSAVGCGWNAELYFHEEEQKPPKKSKSPWHWLVPIRSTLKSN